jgi:cell shape-determining protein MreD
MIRYTFSVVVLLLAAVIVQQFLPAFPDFHRARILVVPLVFLCSAVTMGTPSMLLLAFICGFLWDAQNALGPDGGDPDVYTHPVASLRFGYSILLYAFIGFIMQGVRPWFRSGRWQFSVPLACISLFVYLALEYLLLVFVRGDLSVSAAVSRQIILTAALTTLFAPPVFWLLSRLARWCGVESSTDESPRQGRYSLPP